MSFDAAFQPRGNAVPITVTTGQSAVAVFGAGSQPEESTQYRFKWNGTAEVYVGYDNLTDPTGKNKATITLTPIPTAAYKGFSMLAGTVEVFTLPAGMQLVTIGAGAGTLEITPGIGL